MKIKKLLCRIFPHRYRGWSLGDYQVCANCGDVIPPIRWPGGNARAHLATGSTGSAGSHTHSSGD